MMEKDKIVKTPSGISMGGGQDTRRRAAHVIEVTRASWRDAGISRSGTAVRDHWRAAQPSMVSAAEDLEAALAAGALLAQLQGYRRAGAVLESNQVTQWPAQCQVAEIRARIGAPAENDACYRAAVRHLRQPSIRAWQARRSTP